MGPSELLWLCPAPFWTFVLSFFSSLVVQTKVQGVGFLKIHAPWNVLCREAELMKLKMPTKKVHSPSVGFRVEVCGECFIFPKPSVVGLRSQAVGRRHPEDQLPGR